MTLILEVDDEPGIGSSACQAPEEAGYQTVAAASANEAKAVIGLDPGALHIGVDGPAASRYLPCPLHQAFLPKPYSNEALVEAVSHPAGRQRPSLSALKLRREKRTPSLAK